jgi:hypothetical protein
MLKKKPLNTQKHLDSFCVPQQRLSSFTISSPPLTRRTLGENSTQEERDQYLKSLFAMSLMRYPYYDQPWKYASSINTSMAQLNKSEISNIMLKVLTRIRVYS